LANYAISRGAVVNVHAAARLGLFDALKELVSRDPALVHGRGGDGQTPLHFASTVEIADFLLDRGAEIDARDVDHESTPAQYMVADRQKIVRRLIERGCATDIFIAAALGDLQLARKHLAADPSCTGWRINDEVFRKRNPHAGGTIYYWTLGWHVSPAEVARKFQHPELAAFLLEQSSDATRLIAACYAHDKTTLRSILATNPRIIEELSDAERRQIANAARNNDTEAVRLMLTAEFPIDARGQHGAPPLYWAAWHGNGALVSELIQRGASLEVSGLEFPGTALSWAIHGSENGWWKEKGDYASTVDALIRAGAKLPDKPGGTEAVRDILRQHGLE
jgi:ankyrin repeat protein